MNVKEFIQKSPVGDKFVVMPNETVQNKELSWAARGMLTYIMSLDSKWKIYVSELANHSKDGVHSTRSAFNELIDAGYVTKEVLREKGRIVEVNYYAKRDLEANKPYSGFPHQENLDTENLDTENHTLKKKHSKNETLKKETYKGEKDLEWAYRCIDEIYRDTLSFLHKGKDIDKAINQAYGDLITNELEWKNCDTSLFKKKVNYQLGKQRIAKDNSSGVDHIIL